MQPSFSLYGAYLRIFEFTYTAKLFALNTPREIRIAFDFLLSAGQAGNGEALSRLSSFRHAPVSINAFTINYGLTVGTVIIKVAQAFAWNFFLLHKPRQKLLSGPNLRTQAVTRWNDIGVLIVG
jgi:hypothetical protein